MGHFEEAQYRFNANGEFRFLPSFVHCLSFPFLAFLSHLVPSRPVAPTPPFQYISYTFFQSPHIHIFHTVPYSEASVAYF